MRISPSFSNFTHVRSTPRDDLIAQTPLIPGDSLIIEVYVTNGGRDQVQIIASNVIHSFRNVFQLMRDSEKVRGGGCRAERLCQRNLFFVFL